MRRDLRLTVLVAALGATASCRQVLGLHPQPAATPPARCSDPLMIDDMEDGDATICASQGRVGTWYTAGDGTSTDLSPASSAPFAPSRIPGGRGTSQLAARFSGSGFTEWGALMGLGLSSVGAGNVPYNASATGGIRFWLKNDVPVTVELPTPGTVLPASGGRCLDTAVQHNCGNHFSVRIETTSSDWVEYSVPYASLAQLQPNGTAVFNTSELLEIQFLAGPGAPFDVWVDDITFYECATSDCVPTCPDPALPVACPARGAHRAACFPPGVDCAVFGVGCADPTVIDDLEDGDDRVCASGGRNGVWGVISDGTSTDLVPAAGAVFAPTPIPGGRGTSLYAARLAGSGFTDWGAILSVSMLDSGFYDASGFDGIQFWMKSDAPVTMAIDTAAASLVNPGEPCVTGYCASYFLFGLSAPAAGGWARYEVPFAALERIPTVDQDGNMHAGRTIWDPQHLASMKFWVAGALQPFEVWIDDLGFYNCSDDDCVPTCNDPMLPVACPTPQGALAGCWPAGTDCSDSADILDSFGVWGSGPDDVWAVGYSRIGIYGSLLHWDGSAWSPVDTDTILPFWGVSGSGPHDVWVAADAGTVLQGDDGVWSAASAGTTASLRGVWVRAPGDVWAIANAGTLLRWNGASWYVSIDSRDPLGCVWGSGVEDVWAVGAAGTILHFGSAGWSQGQSGTKTLSGVWGSGPKDVWAVGEAGTILHFDGSAWAAVTSPTTHDLRWVWGSAQDVVWAVGQAGTILRFDGRSWSTFPSPTSADLNGVWGSDGNHVWAVGNYNTILRFDGNRWSSDPITWTF
jgi:hypothetical protein